MHQSKQQPFLTKTQTTHTLAITAFVIWLCIVTGCAISLIVMLQSGYRFDSSIVALLPEDTRSSARMIAEQHQLKNADEHIVLLIESSKTSPSAALANVIVDRLNSSGVFRKVHGKIETIQNNPWNNFYYSKRYQVLSTQQRQQLQDPASPLVDESLGRLYSPLASLVGGQIIEDPLQLFWQWKNTITPKSVLDIQDGWLTRTIGTTHYRMIRVELSASPYDIDYQQRVLHILDELESMMPEDMHLHRAGLLLHAAYGAKQATREISTIGFGSALGILLLLLYCFRRITTVLLAFLPLITGCLVATTLSIWVFDKVHLVTLAFGAGLVGVAIDYALHYCCANMADQQVKLPAKSVLQRILPGLSLGLMSSVLAYTAQAMAPFPGLQQMAFFSATGLISAWLCVVCWLPILQPKSHTFHNPAWFIQLQQWQTRWPRISSIPQIFIVAIGAITLFIGVANIKGNDDIRLLQTSPATLLAQDKMIKTLIGHSSTHRYFVLSAQNPQTLLENEEALDEKLQALVSKGTLTRTQASSHYVPSLKRQHDNHQLLQDWVYNADGQLHQLAQKGRLTSIEAAAKRAYKMTPIDQFTPADWLHAEVSQIAPPLWIGKHDDRYYSMIEVFHSSTSTAYANSQSQLTALAASIANVEYVDRVADISTLLSHYRAQLMQWLLIAYGVVLCLLALRYHKKTWRVIAAPALASLIAISILHVSGSAITLFHWLALLLVLGIGLDASLFLQESQSAPATWLAVILSSITTLLAFGLLGLSETPVLHYFGETVLLGILFVLVLAPFFAERPPINTGQ